MTERDPLLHGPGLGGPGVATPGVATPGVATPGVATPGVTTPHMVAEPVADFENSPIGEDFVSLHLSPWKILDYVKANNPGQMLVLKTLVGLFGLTWLGAVLSWNLGGRATTLSVLDKVPEAAWDLVQNQSRGMDVRGLVYQIVFMFKQMSLFMAPFWTLVPSITWAALATVGLYIMGRRQADAFFKLLFIALISQWFNVWRLVPVTGGVTVTFAQLGFGIYGIMRVFDVSLKSAFLVIYLVPMLVISALLVVMIAAMAAI